MVPVVAVMVAAVVAVVAVGAIVLVGCGASRSHRSAASVTAIKGLPPVPLFDSSTRQAYGYLSRARQTVSEHDPSCRAITRQDATDRAAGATDRQLLEIFGVLDLPAGAAPARAPTDGPFAQVFVGSARIATRLDGVSLIVSDP